MSKAKAENDSIGTDKHNAIRDWIQQQEAQSSRAEPEWDDLESLPESSMVASSVSDTDLESNVDDDILTTKTLDVSKISTITESLRDLLNSMTTIQTENVNISNSTNVHIGNITNINGNIQIIQQHIKGKAKRSSKANEEQPEEREERVGSDAFLDQINIKIPKSLCSIVPRHAWLAQVPMEAYDYLEKPVKFVIISHTATESSEKQAINIRTTRDIQSFHIESRGWNDISYNFLVGCDGNCYEGRGWGVVGAHTKGYNKRSIGISFIGCFMRVLPSEAAVSACKNLLQMGVDEGHIAADYKLLCHCQCRATESPGRKLFEEIQKWDHFSTTEDLNI